MSRTRFGWDRLVRFVLPTLVAASFAGAAQTASAAGLIGARAAHAAAERAGAPGLPAVAAPTFVATRSSLENGVDSARVSFDLSCAGAGCGENAAAALLLKAFVLGEPDRVIVDVPNFVFDTDPVTGKLAAGHRRRARGHDLVTAYRFGLLAPGRSRIVIDLGSPARIVSAAVETVGGRLKLVVALTRTDRAAFREAVRSMTSAPPAAPQAPVVASAGRPIIVIDPGHGGPDTGAIVNGLVEKDVVLAFAKLLARKLEASGGFSIVMTRDSDVFIPLSERVRIARNAGAALMISVHADTLPETSDVSGATVYTVSDRASDAYAAKVAAKENDADASVGVDGQADVADVNDILFDLTRQETRAYSHVFARTLVNYWKVAGRLNKNPQRAAGFVVLKAPDVPSVLLELGYLSSPTDAADLTSDAWRDRATGQMSGAILAYFADRQGPAKAAAGVSIPLKQAIAEAPARD